MHGTERTTRPLILHCFDGLGVGGAERQLVLLLRHLREERFAHAVCHLGLLADLAPQIRDLGVAVYDLSGGGRRSVRAFSRLLSLTRRLKPDLIHADHDFGKLVARMVGAVMRVPVLATMGNTLSQQVLGVSGPRRRWRVVPGLLDLAYRLVPDAPRNHYMAVSRTVKASLVADGVPADHISVVRRGVDLGEFVLDPADRVDALRATLGLEGAGPILLNVGRLVYQKGQEEIIRALPVIRRHHPGARLLLAGDGPRRGEYRALAAREGVADAVTFLGTTSDIRWLLQLADVFVFPSRFEGAGGALLEAMAMSRPCVVSRLPELEEILGGDDAGMLVPRTAGAFAEAVLRVLADPAGRDRMGRRARQIVEERFDARKTALDFIRLCEQVIEAWRAGRPAVAVS